MSERVLEGMRLVLALREEAMKRSCYTMTFNGEGERLALDADKHCAKILAAVAEYRATVAELAFLESQYAAVDANAGGRTKVRRMGQKNERA